MDVRGLGALAALLLWPGLLVVRAPWPAVPFLSLSFWLLTWWWLPPEAGRSTFLGVALACFVLLSGLRLLKPLALSIPSRGTLYALSVAGACLLPLAWLEVAPGSSLAAMEARLCVWRDGPPRTYEPLAPVPRFGAHAPGLPFLAADVSLLSGLAPHRTTAAASCVSAGLLVVGVTFFGRRLGRETVASVVAVAVLTLLLVAGAFPGPGSALLAASFGLAGVSLLVRGSGRSPAVAGGAFLAAALTVEAGVGGLALLVAVGMARPRPRGFLTLALALGLAAPRLLAFIPAWSLAELRSVRLGSAMRGAGTSVDGDALRAMAWIRDHSGPLERVCAEPGGPGRFLPSIAGRAAMPAEVPIVYRDEAARAPGSRDRCRYALRFPADPDEERFVTASEASAPLWREVFRAGGVRVLAATSIEGSVTSFDTPGGNTAQPPP